MPSVKLPDGQVVQFPDDMAPEQIQERVTAYLGRTRPTDPYGQPAAPAARSIDEVVRDGVRLAGRIRSGDTPIENLTPAETLSVRLAVRDLKPADLTTQDKGTLGMKTGMLEEFKRGFMDQPPTATIEPKWAAGFRGGIRDPSGAVIHPSTAIGRSARRGVEAAKEAMTRPIDELPVSGRLKRLFETEGEPEWARKLKQIPAEAFGLLERVPSAIFSAPIAAMTEDPKQQEILGNTLMAGLAAKGPSTKHLVKEQIPSLMRLRQGEPMDLKGGLVPPPGVESLPSETGARLRSTGLTPPRRTGEAEQPFRMADVTGEGLERARPVSRQGMPGPTGFEILDRARQTRRQLTGTVGIPKAIPAESTAETAAYSPIPQGALGAAEEPAALTGQVGLPKGLPEAPREMSVRPAEGGPLTVTGPGPQRDPRLIEPKPEEPALPTAGEVAGKRAGMWPKVHEPSQILDPFGRPLMSEPPAPRPPLRQQIGGGRAERVPRGKQDVGPSGMEILQGKKPAELADLPRVTGEVTPAPVDQGYDRAAWLKGENATTETGISGFQKPPVTPSEPPVTAPVTGPSAGGKFPREAFKGFLVTENGEHLNVYFHQGKGFVVRVRPGGRGEIEEMVHADMPPSAFERTGSVPGGTQNAPRIPTWKIKPEAAQPAGPRLAPPTEMTPMGEQGLLGGTPARSIPTGKTLAPGGQRPVSETPLFEKPGPEQATLPSGRQGAGRSADRIRQLEQEQTQVFNELLPRYGQNHEAAMQAARQDSRWFRAQREIDALRGGAGPLEPPPTVKEPKGGSTRERAPDTRETVNLQDPDSVVAWIKGEGGLRASAESKGINIPFLRKKTGLPLDELAQNYADVRGGTAKQAEDQITRTLQNYGMLKDAKRRGEGGFTRPVESGVQQGGLASDPGFQLRPEANAAEPPGKYAKTIYPEEWNGMSPAERSEMMNFFDSMGRSNPQLMATLGGTGVLAALAPKLLSNFQGQPQDTEGGQHPLIGRLVNTIRDIKDKLTQGPTSPLLTPEAARSDKRRLEERMSELGRLAVAAVPLIAGVMAAGRGGGMRGGGMTPGGIPREPIAPVRGSTLTPPPAAAWAETVRPTTPPPPVGPPPPPTPMGMEPPPSGPWQGVPGYQATGTAFRGLRDLGRQAYSTILGRMEQWGPAGQEVSRLMQRVQSDSMRFTGQYVDPVVTALHRLSKDEKANFVEVAEGRAQPMTEAVRKIHEEMYLPVFGPMGVIPLEANKRGVMTRAFGEAKPFQPREQFYPHEFDPAYVREILRPQSPARRLAIEQLAEREGIDPGNAEVMLDDYFRASVTRQGNRIVYLEPDRFVGGLERARELNIDGYIKDPEVAIGLRGWKVAKRFAEIDHYGYEDAVIGQSSRVMSRPPTGPTKPTGLIGQIQEQYGSQEATKAYQLFKYVVGSPVEESAMQSLVQGVNTVEAFTKLPLAFIANATQPVLTAFRTSVAASARGLMDAVLHPTASREGAQQLGVIADMSIRELYQELRGGYPNKLTDFALKPFNIVEKWNRIVAANTGKVWARELDTWLHRGQRDGFVRRELDRLNFGREEVQNIMDRHALREGDGERIAWGIVDQTQYLAGKARRSELFYGHPIGPLVMQFKNFGINTGRLMHQMIGEEIVQHRDPRFMLNTIATFGVLFPLVGEVALDARALLRGRSRDTTMETPAARLMENFMAVGGLGIATDFIQSLTKGGRTAALEFVFGPAFSDAARLSKHAVEMATAIGGEDGDFAKATHDAARFGARNIPFVGPTLSEALRSDKTAAADAEKTWQQRLGLDPVEARVRRIEVEDRQRKATQARANQLASEGKMDEAREVIDTWSALHESTIGLSSTAIQRRQRAAQQTPEEKRRSRLSPAARARLQRELEAR